MDGTTRQHAARRGYVLVVAHERMSFTYRLIYVVSIVMAFRRALVLVGNYGTSVQGQLGLGGGS